MHIHSSELNNAINLKNAGHKKEAQQLFHQMIKEDINVDRSYYHLGLMAAEEKNIPEAINYYKQAIETNADYHKSHNNLGLLYLEQKRYEEAIDHLESAHELAPDDIQPLVNLGHAYYQTHDFSTALTYYTEVNLTELEPPLQEEILTAIGDCYLQLQQFDKAEAMYKNVLNQFSQNNIVALNQLGFINLEIKHNLQEAKQWIDKALAVNDQFKPAIQNKGLILKAAGRPAEAIPFLTKVIELDPNNFEGYYNMACVYADLENEDLIKSNLQKAVALAPFIKQHVQHDKDFAKYNQQEWFRKLM